MPRGDRTGPTGFGPATGRGMGYCAGNAGPGFMYPGPGPGFGRGGGFGRGLGRGFGLGRGYGRQHLGLGRFWGYPYPQTTPYSSYQPFNEEQEIDFLDNQTKMLEDELKQMKKRQEELKMRKQENK